MNCNTTHYRANSSSVPGDPTFHLQNPDSHAYVILPIALSLLLASKGLSFLFGNILRLPRLALITLMAICVSWIPEGLRSFKTLRGEGADLLSRQLDSAPPRSLLSTGSDHWLFPLWYRRFVEKRRPDTAIISPGLYRAAWYREQTARTFGPLDHRPIFFENQRGRSDALSGLLFGPAADIPGNRSLFIEECKTMRPLDPFGTVGGVCAQVILNAVGQLHQNRDEVAHAVSLLEIFGDVAESKIACHPVAPVKLIYPLETAERFLPPTHRPMTYLAQIYIGCGRKDAATGLLASHRDDVNGALLYAHLLLEHSGPQPAIDYLVGRKREFRPERKAIDRAIQILREFQDRT